MHEPTKHYLVLRFLAATVVLTGFLPVGLFAEPVILMSEIRSVGIPKETKAELTLQIRRQLQSIAKVAAPSNNQLSSNCLENNACLQRLTAERGITHLLDTQVNGIGSTFYVTLKLTDLQDHASSAQTFKEQGKRATSTFEEIAKRAVENMITTAGLQKKSLDTTLATATGAVDHDNAVATLRAEPIAVTTTKVRRRSQEWYEKWWVWTIVGSVAAGAATAAVLSLDGGDAESVNSGANNIGGGGGGGSSSASTIQVDIAIK